MKYNKIVKENDYNINSFLITTISCVVLLLTLCYFGINGGVKGTYSATEYTCDNGWTLVSGQSFCCPTGFSYDTDSKKCEKLYLNDSYQSTCAAFGYTWTSEYEDATYYYYCKGDPRTRKTVTTNTVTFSANGGSVSSGSTKITCTATNGACSIASSETPTVTKNGYDFNGWSSVTNCPSGVGSTGTLTVYGDVTMYACWKENEAGADTTTNTIKFNPNGGSVSSGSIEITCTPTNGACSIASSKTPTVTKNGYTFNGWSSATNCPSGVGTTGTLTVYGDATMYACWKETTKCYFCSGNNTFQWNPTSTSGCEVRFSYTTQSTCLAQNYACYECTDDDGGTSYVYGQVEVYATSKVCTRKGGYNLGKSNCDAYSSTPSTPSDPGDDEPSNPSTPSNPDPGDDDDTTPSEPTKKTYTATFDPNGGTLDGEKTKSCSTTGNSCTISGLPKATKSGYTFKGWGTSKTCTSGNTNSVELASSKTFYACWVKKSSTTNPSDPELPDDENILDNPPTGQTTLIAIIWFVGLMAIGYAFYYYKNVRKNN